MLHVSIKCLAATVACAFAIFSGSEAFAQQSETFRARLLNEFAALARRIESSPSIPEQWPQFSQRTANVLAHPGEPSFAVLSDLHNDAYEFSQFGVDKFRSNIWDWTSNLAADPLHAAIEAAISEGSADVHSLAEQIKATQSAMRLSLAESSSTIPSSWRSYLQWEQTERIAQSADLKYSEVRTLANRWNSAKSVWPSRATEKIAEQTARLAGLLLQSEMPEPQEAFISRLARLQSICSHAKLPLANEELREVETIYTHLSQRYQAISVCRALENHFSYANLIVRVDPQVLNKSTDTSINRTTPISTNVAGSNIKGTAELDGDIKMTFSPSISDLQMTLSLQGVNTSRTEGGRDGVRVRSTAITQLSGERTLSIREFQPPTWGQLRTNASSYVSFDSISTSFGGRRRAIAIERVQATKSQSEASASAEAKRWLDQELRQTTDSFLANSQFNDLFRFRDRLLKRDVSSPQLNIGVIPNRIDWRLKYAPQGKFAASASPPVSTLSGEVQLAVHMSFFENACLAEFGGVSLNAEGARRKSLGLLQNHVSETTKSLSQPNVASPNSSVRFALDRPIAWQIAPERITLRLELVEIESEGEVYRDYSLILPYRPAISNNRLTFVPDGELKVVPQGHDPENGAVSARKIPICRLLERNLNKFFSDAMEIPTPTIPVAGTLNRQEMMIVGYQTEEGWLLISYNP